MILDLMKKSECEKNLHFVGSLNEAFHLHISFASKDLYLHRYEARLFVHNLIKNLFSC